MRRNLRPLCATERDGAIAGVAARHGIDPGEIHPGRSHVRRVSRARQEVYWLLQFQGYSLAEIGAAMDRHHTTIMYGINRHLERA